MKTLKKSKLNKNENFEKKNENFEIKIK